MTVLPFAPRYARGIEAQINYCTLVVRIERMRRLVRILLEQRAMKFTWLPAVAGEIEKIGSEIEDDARKLITEDIPALRARKQNTFDGAKRHLSDGHGALTSLNGMLDALDKATNGGPTLGDSSQSPADAQPSEGAALNQGQPG